MQAQRTQACRVCADPCAVHPRTHNQHVLQTRILLCDCPVGAERASKILGIKPSAHLQHRAMNAVEGWGDVPSLPEVLVGAVLHLFIEQRIMNESSNALQIRPVLQKEGITVVCPVVELAEVRCWVLRSVGAGSEVVRVQLELGGKHESTVVVCVVSFEQIRDRSL